VIRKIPDDVQAAIDAKVASGQYADEETVLREAMASLTEFDEDVAKVQEAIEHWQAGDEGMPVDDAFEMVRREVGDASGRHSHRCDQ
jgi:Arc/MetJ-type ribon-helix-helix transcriptional regulator